MRAKQKLFVQVTNSGRKQGKSNFCVLKVMNKIHWNILGCAQAPPVWNLPHCSPRNQGDTIGLKLDSDQPPKKHY